VFGLNGFVIGPLIAAMFMVSWEIFSTSRRDEPVGDANP
jgi:predicted PurR-regulated permease PerM